MEALDDLLDLLMLEHVHDPDRIEAGRFALIDPASPVVEEICLLADGLNARLEAYHDAMGESGGSGRTAGGGMSTVCMIGFAPRASPISSMVST